MSTERTKWVAIGVVGSLFAASHIGMIGLISTRNNSKLPTFNLPNTPYSAYTIKAGEKGYEVLYRANDPKVMYHQRDIVRKGGFLGLANNKTKVTEQYTMDGSRHHGGPVSTRSSWIDPSAQGGEDGKKLSAKTVECIKAVGGGEQSGRLVGTSIGASAAPALSGIPFVGWLAAGWVAMFGGEQGANIGGGMAQDLTDACLEEEAK
tara:strand:+ start:6268 stop:6885 length:618 start_codon:yes stop_codon:yes gene_type:complete